MMRSSNIGRLIPVTFVMATMLWFFADSASAMLHPQQGQFMQRDPLGYVDGMGAYEYVQASPLGSVDPDGLWKKGPGGRNRREYTSDCDDVLADVVYDVNLSILVPQVNKWLQGGTVKFADGTSASTGSLVMADLTKPLKDKQKVTVPNVWIAADLLRGGGLSDKVINIGGTIGIEMGTDLATQGMKVVKAKSFYGLTNAIQSNSGDVWGIVIFGHGWKDGTLVDADQVGGNQRMVISGLAGQGFQVSKAHAMQCYSHYSGTHDGTYYDWQYEWEKVALDANGYKGLNALLIDFR